VGILGDCTEMCRLKGNENAMCWSVSKLGNKVGVYFACGKVYCTCMYTVPFHSIQQSHVTVPSKMLKCHNCYGDFHGVLNSFGNDVTNIVFFLSPAALNHRKFPKNSAGPSRVMGPAKLIEMVQYSLRYKNQEKRKA